MVAHKNKRLALALLGLYVCSFSARTQANDIWKHDIQFPDDPFEQRHYAGPYNMGWIKFTLPIEANEFGPITYQNSKEFALHYDFVSTHLDPYVGIEPEAFNRISLYERDQELILGAIVTPPKGFPLTHAIDELGIQLVRHDPYTREEVVTLFNQVRSSIQAAPEVTVYYFPTFEQRQVAQTHEQWLAQQGIPVSSSDRWQQGNVIYSQGWAFGRLRYIPSNQINAAYLAGRLLSSDILLTDAIPAEIPAVSGILSLSPSTPNSHVAILATTYAIPFVYLAEQTLVEQARALENHPVVVRAIPKNSWESTIDVLDANDVLSEEQTQQLLALKQPASLNIQAIQPFGQYSASTEKLAPHDIVFVGGKAANYALLRESLPNNSRPALALTFDLWNAFLDQSLPTGATLRELIHRRLDPYAFPATMAKLEYDLATIRSFFTDDSVTQFSPELQEAVINALTDPLYGFDPMQKLRFRSSTNVEDSDSFSGAGLYSSFSGCLADELDQDTIGPSLCDPTKSKERGVFRAIRKVFASFYNTNAFVERLRHGINEDQVGMALLVHHSFPDESEWANGVATLKKSSSSSLSLTMVSQTGAVSVANPDPGVLPETVSGSIYTSNSNVYLSTGAFSNLTPMGQNVLTWKQDYEALAHLLTTAANAYEKATGRETYLLDFEYKQIAPDGQLIIKQIRPIPQLIPSDPVAPLLMAQPVNLQLLQGEHSLLFANHRLKSFWTLNCESRWLTPEAVTQGFYTEFDLSYVDGNRIDFLSGSMLTQPDYQHQVLAPDRYGQLQVSDSWTMSPTENTRTYTLVTTGIPPSIASDQCPVITLSDLGFSLEVHYADAVQEKGYSPEDACMTIPTHTDNATLMVQPLPSSDDIPKTRVIDIDDLHIETSFVWPPHPSGPTAGYTAPVIRWENTVITGLTSSPITLTSDFAQTYVPGHHNFWEVFLFEPHLDPNVPQSLLDELRTKGIESILTTFGGAGDVCYYAF